MRQKTGAIGAMLNKSTIRHIQRGQGSMRASGNNYEVSCNISLSGFTDATKMIAIINGNTYSSGSSLDEVRLQELTTNILTVARTAYSGNGLSCNFSYQVIEFY